MALECIKYMGVAVFALTLGWVCYIAVCNGDGGRQ